MKFYKQLICNVFILLFLLLGNAQADTCYSPHYGNYECNPGYSYYPDPGQDFIAGALFGAVIGGAAYGNDGYYRGGGYHGGGGYGGGHGGGRGHGHGGGGGHHHR